jgi:hypothetical protein
MRQVGGRRSGAEKGATRVIIKKEFFEPVKNAVFLHFLNGAK